MITKEMLNQGQTEIFEDILPKIYDALNKYRTLSIKERIFDISGQSGSGKSTLTSVILNELKDSTNIVMTTPTHKALEVLRAMVFNLDADIPAKTIHSHLGLKVQENYRTGKYELVQDSKNNFTEQYDILFCDEASMVSEELFNFIENELVVDNVKVVIFVGDKNQLLPVEGGNNPIYGDYGHTSYELTEVTRQAEGSDIIKIASKLRKCISSGNFEDLRVVTKWIEDLQGAEIEVVNKPDVWLERYYNSEYDFGKNLIVAYKNATVDRYNKLARDKDKGKGIDYILPEEELIFLEAHILNDEYIHRNNEKVTISKCEQEYQEDLDIGFWRVMDTGGRPFRIVDGGSKMDYEYELGELTKKAKKADGVARTMLWKQFFELKNAFQNVSYKYACTAFKSQGSTCKEVFLDVNEILSMERIIGIDMVYRTLYVAITRASEKAILYIR